MNAWRPRHDPRNIAHIMAHRRHDDRDTRAWLRGIGWESRTLWVPRETAPVVATAGLYERRTVTAIAWRGAFVYEATI